MCGIVGFLHSERSRPASRDVVLRMAESVLHRGPDSGGDWVESHVALGHRRLAIIDTSDAGHQPMHATDAHEVIVFNGEIYNYKELRETLRSVGFQFRTESDTEVLLAAYRHWGPDCVQHLNGVWAFAIYDRRTSELFCSRDRLGEKPFFYAVYDNSFVFGSEIKSLFAYGVPTELNMDMLDSYLCFSYIPAPFTFYKGISKLEPGCSLVVRDGQISKMRYWDVPLVKASDQRKDEERIVEEFDELFHDSVQLRMRSDVPFGAFLSGGLDSSSIVRVMSESSDTPVHTFTAGFAERAYDERSLAALVARDFSTDHHSFEINMSDAEHLHRKLASVYDEPFGDSSALPSYLIAAEAKKHVSVILTGDGGDEVLSGYTIHQGERFANLYAKLPSIVRSSLLPASLSLLRKLAPRSIASGILRAEEVVSSSNMSFEQRLLAKQNGFRASEREALGRRKSLLRAEDFLHDTLAPVRQFDSFTQLNYWLTKVALPDDMLCKVDRATMAHALEARLPFLDHRLVELMWQVSIDVKLKGFRRKHVLRKAMHSKLPAEIFSAPKSGFVVPLRRWLQPQQDSSLRMDVLQCGRDGLVNATALNEVLTAQDSGRRDASNALWSLAALNAARQLNGTQNQRQHKAALDANVETLSTLKDRTIQPHSHQEISL